ncbi:hypothetical protein EYZ11_005000 [Aspergillus tanneri]|uniref:General alpha-glucoside permease n=1 Tax=Aspergillus tanneri TaxID=1220188 RepID=A0A4S3JLH0_9EURO|nr:hypothetical protein EYZ11_005000 [Aspergillus tanneri]
MYCLDVAVNTVQAGIRCFIVDNAPAHQQESANAWASRLTGVGNILGYVFGTLFISCLYIRERDPRLESPPSSGNPGIVAFFRQVFKSIKHLPPQIAKICEVQLAAWVGWFPFLFYATTYIGQLYVNPIFIDHPDLPGEKINEAWEKATRIGTFALLIYAIVSFIANITLPLFVVPTYKPTVLTQDRHLSDGLDGEPFLGNRRTSFPSLAGATASAESPSNSSEGKRKWLSKLQIPGFTLRRAWFLSHVLFAVCMFGTFFVYSYQAATVVVGLVGISWALTLWAPFALISAEVARIDAGYRAKHQQSELDEHYSAPNYHADPPVAEYDLENGSSSTTLKVAEEDENLAQAGIILGLHNVAISAPQILSSLICSAIFKVAQKPRGEAWDDSVGWVLRFGGCGAVLAAWLTSRLVEGRG